MTQCVLGPCGGQLEAATERVIRSAGLCPGSCFRTGASCQRQRQLEHAQLPLQLTAAATAAQSEGQLGPQHPGKLGFWLLKLF